MKKIVANSYPCWAGSLRQAFCMMLLCVLLSSLFIFANAQADTTDIVLFDDDACAGVRIDSWGVAAPTALDTAVVKEGTASMKIQYRGNSGQSTSAFFFEPLLNLTPEMRENGILRFWYYSDGVIPQMTIAMTYQTEDDLQSEVRVPLKEGYISDVTGEWQLVQIPLSVFPAVGQTWDAQASAFVDKEFDYGAIKSLVIYAHTREVAEPAPVYLDSMAILIADAQPQAKGQEAEGKGIAYYVSPNGSDQNDGKSPETPLKTAQLAANMTAPGDTVYLMGGTYENHNGAFLSIKRSGEEDAYITYKNFNDEKPIIISGDNVWDTISITASYIKIDGLTLIGLNDSIDLAEATANYDAYIKKQDTGAPYNEESMARTNTNGILINGRPATARGSGTPHHIEIRNCDISKFPQCGVGALDADYILIENNHIHENMYFSIYGSSGISILGSVDIDENDQAYKNIIRNNVVWGNMCYVKCQNGRKWSDGNGIIIDYNKNTGSTNKLPYKGKTLIENNLVYENGGGGIHIFNSSNVDVINNTSYKNGQTPQLHDWGNLSVSWATNVRFINNITVACKLGATPISYGSRNNRILIENNIYYNTENPQNVPSFNGGPRLPADDGILVNNIWQDPAFVDPASYDFRLQPGSPAVDAGIQSAAPAIDLVGSPRPQGAAADIGAYESAYINQDNVVEAETALTPVTAARAAAEEAEAARGTPVVDGEVDEIWENTQLIPLGKYVQGEGAHGTARVMWDEKYLYALVEVVDSELTAQSDKDWNQDSVEFFLDENNAKTEDYEQDDAQYRVNIHNKKTGGTNANLNAFKTAVAVTDEGYLVEAAIPFRVVKPAADMEIGFDIQINDENVNADAPSSICKWSDPQGSTFQDTSRFGDLTLVAYYLHRESDDETVIKVTVDAIEIDRPGAIIYEGSVMLPVRLLEETLGMTVQTDGEALTVSKAERLAETRDCVTIDSISYVPARFLREAFGMDVTWSPDLSLIAIKTNP